MRALIAIRLSVETDATTSPERQLEICQSFAGGRGWTIAGVARDLDVSAVKVRPEERPELGNWLRNRSHEFDVIVCWKLDRIVRSVADLSDLIKAGDRDGFALVSATQPFDLTDMMGRAMAQIVAVFAELEAAMIAERVASARRHMRETGRWAGGHVPFGYMAVPREGGGLTLVPDPELAETIREAAKRALNGESWYTLAAWLTETGVPTPRDADAVRRGKDPKRPVWHPETLAQIMTSPVLLGYAMHKQRPVVGPDGQTLPPAFPEILSDDTHRAVLAEARKRRGNRSERQKGAAPLLGIAVCDECSTQDEHVRLYGDGLTLDKPRYKCTKYANRPVGGCGMTVSVRALDPWVERELLARVGSWHLMEAVTTPGRDVAAELADLDARMEDLRADRAAGIYRSDADAAWFRSTYADMQDERDRLAAIPANDDESPVYRPTGRTVADEWEAADTEARRQLMLDLGVHVHVKRSPRKGKLTQAQMEGRFRMEITNPSALAVEDAYDALAVEDFLHSPEAGAAREASGVRGLNIRVTAA
ncbi:recombinase family protein [Actinomadura barringtoniae]|uniref:Recombinase family protein n=1 Tax=Actinomadura barringtoniae TaxID=1427535 RepID=A0A939TDQ6_9ACTN|nr:recombinase family protein [Actinomadura barringtoniae]MBO2455857.1 recombinase family protein [Actinomadura barringtoniae]